MRIAHPGRILALLAVAGLSLPGCAALPPNDPRTPDHAPVTSDTTALGKSVARAAPGNDVSGLRLLKSGEDAYAALSALIERAQRSLDLQYYMVRDEASSRSLLREVTAAAQRGVKVRVLVDDFNTTGEEDALVCLAQQEGIEVRLYNPFPTGRFSTVSRLLASATDIQRIEARMHNKQLVADNALAVTGGRNLGDAYFVRSPEANFLDLDLLVAGPVVHQLSGAFNAFWNSELAYPIDKLVDRKPDCARSAVTDDKTPGGDNSGTATTKTEPARNALGESLRRGRLDLSWGPASLLADKPSKIESEGKPAPTETVSDDVEHLLSGARREVLVISPYFVPGERGLALFEDLRKRGVTVRVLTNSLAATDALAVHIGYARYREALLAAGVQLYELRPQIGQPRNRVGQFGSSRSSLHAKALVIDRAVALVGSMNMDPRSANLNTEMGLVVRSPQIAAQLADLFVDVTAHSSYAVTLYDGYHLRWTTQRDGREQRYDDEPEATLSRRLMLLLIRPFAPEALL